MKSGQAKNVMEKTLGDLADYAVYHFKTEEQYMEKFHYPEYATHKLAHTAFIKKVTQFQSDFKAGKLGISMELMNFLREWLTTHIKGTDKNYSATFRKGGVR
jgi:hemerythrin